MADDHNPSIGMAASLAHSRATATKDRGIKKPELENIIVKITGGISILIIAYWFVSNFT
jgi:hypothetical protein